MSNFYRFGELKDCERLKDELAFCWKIKSLEADEKKVVA
jgi:hypothetical protein